MCPPVGTFKVRCHQKRERLLGFLVDKSQWQKRSGKDQRSFLQPRFVTFIALHQQYLGSYTSQLRHHCHLMVVTMAAPVAVIVVAVAAAAAVLNHVLFCVSQTTFPQFIQVRPGLKGLLGIVAARFLHARCPSCHPTNSQKKNQTDKCFELINITPGMKAVSPSETQTDLLH